MSIPIWFALAKSRNQIGQLLKYVVQSEISLFGEFTIDMVLDFLMFGFEAWYEYDSLSHSNTCLIFKHEYKKSYDKNDNCETVEIILLNESVYFG